MTGILETISQFKEPAGVVASAVAVLTGIAKTGSEFLQSRSQASRNDKLLAKIQGLAMAHQALAGSLQEAEAARIIESELSEAMRLFAAGSKQEKETQAYERGLSLFQRVFVLYRPSGARAWISQIICWIVMCVLVAGTLGAAVSDETNEFSWKTFRANWADGLWIALLFYLAIFLLARLWAVSERKKYVRTHGEVAVDKKRSGIGMIVAILYGALGVTAIFTGVAFISSGAATVLKFGLFGLVLASASYAVWNLQSVRNRGGSLTGKKAGLLLLPAVLLVVIVVFNAWGIVDASSKNNVLNYWRNCLSQPIIPFIIFPLSAIPLFVSLRSWWVVRRSQPLGATASKPS
jgi:hypothetical protein